MLRAVDVAYGYGRSGAGLASAELEAAPGEIVALLGPNGAGKSTLLRLLDRRLQPARGRVEGPPRRTGRGRLAYGCLDEETVHFNHLPSAEEARFFARAAGLDRASARAAVAALLERFDLAEEARRPVAECSFGERRKLALVEALAHGPPVLLLDEPTVGLDAGARATLSALLAERARAGATVVLASHDTGFVESTVDRVVFLVRGRTRGGGAPAELVAALEGEARIHLLLEGDGVAAEDLTAGSWTVEEAGTRVVVRAPGGARVLPELCRAVAHAGGVVREVTVRPPDLAEAFREALGEPLEPASPDLEAVDR